MKLNAAALANRHRIAKGEGFKLAKHSPGDTGGVETKQAGKALLAEATAAMSELQNRLYAQDQWAVLIILQAMDAAGKDGVIKHVMTGINPQGCQVTSFKQPSAEELDHDFLWRTHKHTPARGHIGIFNRSHYEEVLVVRVHPAFLQGQRLPPDLLTKKIWAQRYEDIRGFEKYLSRNGVAVRKFFLNVSKEEQKQRFLERLDRPEKNWKFSENDVSERAHWNEYMDAYEQMIRNTATPEAPWYVVPADNKWYTRLVVASAIVETLESLELKYPTVDEEKLKGFVAARAALMGEKG